MRNVSRVLKNRCVQKQNDGSIKQRKFVLVGRTMYAAPNLSPTSAAFGTITADATNQNMRQIQIGGRLTW